MLKHTVEWGEIETSLLRQIVCPICKLVFNGRLSGDETKVEMPKHDSTPELECIGGGKWYKIKEKNHVDR